MGFARKFGQAQFFNEIKKIHIRSRRLCANACVGVVDFVV